MIDSNKGSTIGTSTQCNQMKGMIVIVKTKNIYLVFAVVFLSILITVNFTKREQNNYSGIPDMVSCCSCNTVYWMKVVANSRNISDKEAFTKKVINMCRENSFQSIMFSTDVNGYPESLDIAVYLKAEDIGEKEPEFNIRFVPDEWNAGYNIKDDVEHYQLYLDNKQITL